MFNKRKLKWTKSLVFCFQSWNQLFDIQTKKPKHTKSRRQVLCNFWNNSFAEKSEVLLSKREQIKCGNLQLFAQIRDTQTNVSSESKIGRYSISLSIDWADTKC